MGFAISIFLNGSWQMKVVYSTEGFLFFYRSTQPTCPLSSIYGLVLVGWVERSSKVCRYSSNRTLLFSRRVLKNMSSETQRFAPSGALARWVSLYLSSSTVHGTSKLCVESKGILFFYRSTQPTCPLSSIYGLVLVGWVERSSKVCRYSSNRTLLFSRRVLKICQVKPNALRRLQLWLVGFRYIYLLEGFVADESCV